MSDSSVAVSEEARIVTSFRHRQPDDPTSFERGQLPEMNPGETTATCAVCGYWGVVPDDHEVVTAARYETDSVLVCATCATDAE